MARLLEPQSADHPRYVVWELTLRCDLACRHCGSRAGKPRAAELSVDEALAVVPQLAAMGTQEVAFIGGEAWLRDDWRRIVRAVADAGIRPTMTTGARALDAAMARAAADAGLQAISVSVDGLEATHDHLRGVAGSWRAAVDALAHIQAAGMSAYANTQFNRLNLDEVEPLGALLLDAGIRAWQVQLTGPMGRAADRPEWLLQPPDLLVLLPRLAAVAEVAIPRGCTIDAANNLGYYGPFERLLRRAPWQGCQAGRFVLGIESDGSVKGCPSLPSAPYVGGNVRDTPLAELWAQSAPIRFSRDRDLSELWGFCAGCYYAKVCKAGCSWTSHTLLGRRGNMPWCYHRAETLAAQGLQERLVQVERAPGQPFDFGRFELLVEPIREEPRCASS
jgi:radical SAM protein with 4Fe4S-binding SPASM domain